MRITFDTEDVMTVCAAMAKSRGIEINWERPWPPDSLEDHIHTEANGFLVNVRREIAWGDDHDFDNREPGDTGIN